jgi:predicted dehydrogenase
MKNVRVGVIGVGVMGERHCRVYSTLRNANLVGIAEVNAAKGEAVAKDYGTKYFEDYRQLLEKVDAVSLVTPTPYHFRLASDAIEQGVHVLVEKPMTETVDQAIELVRLADERGVTLQVGHIERFNPVFAELKNVISERRLIALNVKRLSSFDVSNTDVDVIRDLMIHDLDLITNLLGTSFESFYAWGRSTSTNATDYAVANFSFTHGPIATLVASRVTEQKIRLIEVIAEGAYIEADLLSKSLLIHRRTFPQYIDNHSASKYRQESVIERIHVPTVEPLLLELRHFIECIADKKPCLVPGQDGLRALQLAQEVASKVSLCNMRLDESQPSL